MPVLKAGVIYLLMKNEYCISYGVRTQWFLDHLNKAIAVAQIEDVVSEICCYCLDRVTQVCHELDNWHH